MNCLGSAPIKRVSWIKTTGGLFYDICFQYSSIKIVYLHLKFYGWLKVFIFISNTIGYFFIVEVVVASNQVNIPYYCLIYGSEGIAS